MDFKFLLKPKHSNSPCVVEEGPNRLLTRGALQEESRLAVFKNGDVTVEYRVFIKSDRVSPFDLAASWRVYQENLRPSTVRGIPDVSINSAPMARIEVRFQFTNVFRIFFFLLLHVVLHIVIFKISFLQGPRVRRGGFSWFYVSLYSIIYTCLVIPELQTFELA